MVGNFDVVSNDGDRIRPCNSNLGYVVNEIWGPTLMSLGGSLPSSAPTLTLSY